MAVASSVTAGIVLLILTVALIVCFGVCWKVRRLRTPLKIVIEDPSATRLKNLNATPPDIVISGYVHIDSIINVCHILFYMSFNCYTEMDLQLLCRDTLKNVILQFFAQTNFMSVYYMYMQGTELLGVLNRIGWLKFHRVFYVKCQKTNFSFPLLPSSCWTVLDKVYLEAGCELHCLIIYSCGLSIQL